MLFKVIVAQAVFEAVAEAASVKVQLDALPTISGTGAGTAATRTAPALRKEPSIEVEEIIARLLNQMFVVMKERQQTNVPQYMYNKRTYEYRFCSIKLCALRPLHIR